MSSKLNLSNEIYSLRKKMKSLPRGKISFGKCGKYYNWYYSDSGRVSYLSKKEKELAEKLCLKNYYSEMLLCLEREKKLFEKYEEAHNKRINITKKYLDKSNPHSRLLSPIIKKKIFDDSAESQAHNLHDEYGEGKIQTLSGIKVRSKSEAMIADALFARNIDFRYEMPIEINGISYFPDFTIIHPVTGEKIYWEHFGLWDSASYREKATKKIYTYGFVDIVPEINLIMSVETSSNPIDIIIIEELIDKFLG